jgi:hypothetical protein
MWNVQRLEVVDAVAKPPRGFGLRQHVIFVHAYVSISAVGAAAGAKSPGAVSDLLRLAIVMRPLQL